MTKNKVVVLKTFLGTRIPQKGTSERENYWKLIEQKGTIIEQHGTNDRVLVLFESNLDDFELENHNPTKNTLWIKVTDLEETT